MTQPSLCYYYGLINRHKEQKEAEKLVLAIGKF